MTDAEAKRLAELERFLVRIAEYDFYGGQGGNGVAVLKAAISAIEEEARRLLRRTP